jgi:glycosyltransferase involved in cell wall biosynthesis
MDGSVSPWICCQIGAREHYAIPRAIHSMQQLAYLFTDAWTPPQSLLQNLPGQSFQSLKERHHPDLNHRNVQSFTADLLRFELTQRLRRKKGWDLITARNHWFQQRVLQRLKTLSPQRSFQPNAPIVFAYSYAARDIFRYAKQQGWRTVLGQIDPGLVEEQIVQAEHQQHPNLSAQNVSAPSTYWQDWQQECALADQIIVNSSWSQQSLLKVGVPEAKISIIPLAYSVPASTQAFTRPYPTAFSPKRPLRVLFLGQIILRKGMAALLEAIQILDNEPIEVWFVGTPGITPPPALRHHPSIRWVGAVSRSSVVQYYQDADLFIFPTLSDGFGLTQLEAQAWKLPLIASSYCGTVVIDQHNGLRLTEVTGDAIANALRYCLKHPQRLAEFSAHAVHPDAFSLASLQKSLAGVFQNGS